MKLFPRHILWLFILITVLSGCAGKPGDIPGTERIASIDPDYTGITIPYNIAPMNFKITEEGTRFHVRFTSSTGNNIEVSSKDGIIDIPEGKWKKMLQENKGNELNIDIYTKNDKKAGRNLKV